MLIEVKGAAEDYCDNDNKVASTMPPQRLERTFRRSGRKQDVNSALNQRDLTDVYRTPHPTTAKHTFFSSAHRTFLG